MNQPGAHPRSNPKAAQKLFAFVQDALVFSTRFPVITRLTEAHAEDLTPARLRIFRTVPSTLRRTECDGYQLQPAAL